MCCKNMIIIILIHFLLIITNSDGGDYCSPNNPFRIADGACSSFEYACYKANDKQCDELQLACKNCPPSNITLTILKKIVSINENQSQYANKTVELVLEVKNIVESRHQISISLWIFVIINILLISISLILWIVYLNKRKYIQFSCCASQKKKINKNTDNAEQNGLMNKGETSAQVIVEEQVYSMLPSGAYTQDVYEQIRTDITDLYESIRKDIKEFIMEYQIKTDVIQQTSRSPPCFTYCTIQFQFDGIDQEPIELYVHNNHNIVQVKQQISAKLPHAKHDDYKIMRLKYNGVILNDDNQYLLENIDKSNTIVNCFIDSTINASDMVVVKLHGKMRLPDIIQINKNQTVDQLKELIGKIIHSQDFLLFKQSNGSIKIEELRDNLNNLMDGDWIRIVTKEFGKLIIRSIFDDEDSITIEYVNVDLVSSLITSISNKSNSDLNNYVLFYNNKCLEEGKYIFENQISSESAVKYCCFMKWTGIKMDDQYFIKGDFSELKYGTFINTNRKILVKKYEVKSSKTWKNEEFMLKELITFQITKSHRRFIQLLGVYIEDTTLYVVMENMDGGTLKTFLQENYDKIDKNIIYKWSAQILVGLKFLHENKVIHRDLNPSSILVDGNDDLKLSSFNLSKYLDIYKPSSIMGKRDKKEELPVRYMAPEILNSEIYGEACDVWSFGAVLIRIVTNEKPYSNLTKIEALSQISKQKVIEYNLPDKYSEFKSIIDSCLKYEPIKRETVNKLMTNENIQNYL